MGVNLESKQGLSLDLNLQYPESHEMFLVLSLTESGIFWIPFLLSVDSVISFLMFDPVLKCILSLKNVHDNENDEVLLVMDCSFLL